MFINNSTSKVSSKNKNDAEEVNDLTEASSLGSRDLNGKRRSTRLNAIVNNEKTSIEEEEIVPLKKRNFKEKNEEVIELKKDEESSELVHESKIEMNDVRRMVKKAIARNKLST